MAGRQKCAAVTGATLWSQREALELLGISAALPSAADSSYALGLERASQARELLDPAGLGGFARLMQEIGVDLGWMTA